MIADSVLNFGALLKRYRMAAGLTHAELAERAGLSIRAISDLERGVNRKPRKDSVRMLAVALDLSPNDRAAFEAAARRSVGPPAQAHALPGTQTVQGMRLPYVGRAHERARLMRHLTGDGPPLLMLVGEPGIGKTRLLQEAIQESAGRGWGVLSGGCHRRSGDEPYAPLIGALERHIEGQPAAQRREALRGCAWLARMLPELAAEALPLPTWEVPPAQERRLIFKAAAAYLANVAGPRGALLFLDDLQWAGQDALDLLAWLVRSSATVPLRVIGAYRDTEIGTSSPLAQFVADLARDGLAERIELAALPDDAAAQLIADLVSEPAVREQVIRRAEGVPFVLVSCALALQGGGPAVSAELELPWVVAVTIRQRIAILKEPAPDLLAAAAVVGRRIPLPLLVGLAQRLGWQQHELLVAVDAACRARLLTEDNDDAYLFAHDLIREVVAADLSAARRATLHRQVAELLEAQPGDLPIETLAYHYTLAGATEKAAIYLERAGDRALGMHANAEAEAHYRDLVRTLDALHRPGDAARAREKLARVLRISARFDSALEVVEQALATYRTAGDIEEIARVGETIGWLHMLRGTMAEGLPVVTGLLEDLTRQGLSPGGRAHLHMGLAQLYFSAGRYAELGQAAQHTLDLAREAGDERLAALALSKRAIALCELGQVAEGIQALEESRQLMESSGDEWNLCTVLNNLAVIYDNEGDFRQARDYVERALVLAERIGHTENVALMTYRRGQEAFHLGDWARARADYERAIALSQEVGDVRGASYPPSKLARLALAEGRTDEAIHYSRTALDAAMRKHDAQSMRYIQSTLAEDDVLHGRPQAALDRLLPLLDGSSEETSSAAVLLPLVAWAYVERGDMSTAVDLLERAAPLLEAARDRVTLILLLQVRAQIAIHERRWQEAASALDEACAMAHTMPFPYAEAKVLYFYGMLLQRKGKPAEAIQRFADALDILHRLGERLYAAEVERALSELAERRPARVKRGDGGDTASQTRQD
ncbi:MAG TPA: tetratricopeptide repeat protein [Ktedonobacterales bacterium]|nr:tetratricopeptide repeat protein [Ktedonobacterales bacterium]